jgi:hypothetical protein
MGGGAAGSAPRAVADDVCARLFTDAEVASLFAPAAMLTRELYDAKALTAFVQDASHPGFTPARRLGRVLTLELVARTLADLS